MTTIYVQYNDEGKTKIISVFSCPQDEVEYPNQGSVDTGDEIYQNFIQSLPKIFLSPGDE